MAPYISYQGNDEANLTYEWREEPVPMQVCKEGSFLVENDTTKDMGITDFYTCPVDEFQVKLRGNWAAE